MAKDLSKLKKDELVKKLAARLSKEQLVELLQAAPKDKAIGLNWQGAAAAAPAPAAPIPDSGQQSQPAPVQATVGPASPPSGSGAGY